MDLVETQVGKVCGTCGDIGIMGALVTCTRCKIGCEHLYCMSKFSMVASADWCCEMCRSTDLASSDHGSKKVSSEDVSCNLSTKPTSYDVTRNLSAESPHYFIEFTDRKKICKGARSNWNEKAVGKGKTKYLWTNEVKNMPSGEKKGEPTCVGLVSSKPSESVASGRSIGRMNPKSINQVGSSYMVKRNPKFGSPRYSELKAILNPVKDHRQMKPTSSVKDVKTSPAKKQKGMGKTASASQMSRHNQTCDITQTDASLSPAVALLSTEVTERTNGHLQKTTGKEPCADCQSSLSGAKLTNDAKPKYLDAGSVIFKVKEFYIKAAAEEPLPTNPDPDASWMGSFILKDEETSISVQAHTTSQGLSKVKMLCKKMPKVLEFELFSYKDFLRTVFKGCDPDDQDIGLYFFPDNRIRPEVYISHLEQLSGNYFLRSCIDGVELLVFTSKVLHKDYRKRNKCDFLWGIYRRRHRKLKGAAEETMAADMDIDAEDVDMEVDMLGGEIVGPVDVVVPKQSVESNINIPPGFSTSMRGQWNNSPQNFEHVASGKQDDVPRGFTALMKIKEEVQ